MYLRLKNHTNYEFFLNLSEINSFGIMDDDSGETLRGKVCVLGSSGTIWYLNEESSEKFLKVFSDQSIKYFYEGFKEEA